MKGIYMFAWTDYTKLHMTVSETGLEQLYIYRQCRMHFFNPQKTVVNMIRSNNSRSLVCLRHIF